MPRPYLSDVSDVDDRGPSSRTTDLHRAWHIEMRAVNSKIRPDQNRRRIPLVDSAGSRPERASWNHDAHVSVYWWVY